MDFVARYGGEEFAITLPNIDRLVAAGIRVSVRRAVEENVVEFEETRHCVAVSVANAEWDPASPDIALDAALVVVFIRAGLRSAALWFRTSRVTPYNARDKFNSIEER